MTVSKRSLDGTGFVMAGIDRLFSWGMTYGMCHGSAGIRDYVHLCFVLK